MLNRNDCPEVSVHCACGCTRIVATRYDWDEENLDYEVRLESSYIRYNCNSIWMRIVDAFKILFGKRPAYADLVFESKEDFKRWIDGCNGLLK